MAAFTVILARMDARDPMGLARALAAARKTPLQDQMMIAKSSWGILAENLGEPEARSLAEQLQQGGVECQVLASSSLVPLPAAESVATFEALAARPILVAAAAIPITSTTTKTVKEGPSAAQKVLSTAILLGTGLPIKIGGSERTVEKTQHHSDLFFYLDLLYKDPPRRLRITADNFDYSFLKERKLYQVLGNFKLLVGDLVRANPEAWTNHGTRILMEGKPPATQQGGRSPDVWRSIQTMGYTSLGDLERETRWLLTLQNHGPV